MGILAKKKVIDLAFTHFAPQKAFEIARPARPAIVTLHGFLGCRHNLNAMNRRLAENLGMDIYGVDQRNHGDSLRCTPYDYVTLTNDLTYFIKTHLGDRPVSAVGFSSGAKIAMLSLLAKGVNVKSCVSIDLPPYPTPELDDIIRVNQAKIMALIRGEIKILKGTPDWKKKVLGEFQKITFNSQDLASYFAGGFCYNKVNDLMDAERPFIEYSVPLQEMPDVLTSVAEWPEPEQLESTLYNVETSKPILFLKALKSDFIRSDYSLLGKQFKNYRVKEFPTNHNILGESYTESMDAIEEFLAENC